MPGFIQLATLMVLIAQSPQFEVATVKPEGRALLQAVPGRLMMQNLAPRRLALVAYDSGLSAYRRRGRWAIAANLSRTYNSVLGRNVIDRTGLAGTFDFQLKWANDPLSPNPPLVSNPAVEVLVIDHIEIATAN